MRELTSIEICAGAGGQALGLEKAGFNHLSLIEIDKHACATLNYNRPQWNVVWGDISSFSAKPFAGIDLIAGGIPCPPFSRAGKQLGEEDERNLFPEVLRLTRECLPRVLMIENVRGLLDSVFDDYRLYITRELEAIGYVVFWKLLNACDYGVSQLRPRSVLVAMKKPYALKFEWPTVNNIKPLTVGELLLDEMSSHGWEGANEWAHIAKNIAPTLVGGSKKHGGPDLGPTRSRHAWRMLGVDGSTIANAPPQKGFNGLPRLTVKMASLVQGFPQNWHIAGSKTTAYRQVGNAFPPPVAEAVGMSIASTIYMTESKSRKVIA